MSDYKLVSRRIGSIPILIPHNLDVFDKSNALSGLKMNHYVFIRAKEEDKPDLRSPSGSKAYNGLSLEDILIEAGAQVLVIASLFLSMTLFFTSVDNFRTCWPIVRRRSSRIRSLVPRQELNHFASVNHHLLRRWSTSMESTLTLSAFSFLCARRTRQRRPKRRVSALFPIGKLRWR